MLIPEATRPVDPSSRPRAGSELRKTGANLLHVLAGLHFGLPVSGTMAYSYIQAHETRRQPSKRMQLYPGTTLLVNTYDSLKAVDKIIAGDMAALAREARKRHGVRISAAVRDLRGSALSRLQGRG